MVESADEIPISYLNKGQVYDITVMDLRPPMITPEPLQYRTFIRISFDIEEQRLNPAACWQMWEDSRGMSEAQQRGSEPLAIEFIPDGERHQHFQIEQVSVDGFCVTWVVEPGSRSQSCSIPIQFNFLSTDFSHSKGVRGVPVRLCAKTELLSLEDTANPRGSEVCYCKVKLFRDHGAERKVANDLAHVRKAIGKLEQQIYDAGVSGRPGKRRRGNNTSTDMTGSDEISLGSIQSGTQDDSVEDDLQEKLAITHAMVSSVRSVSVLALQGDKGDDPDQSPIQLARGQTSTNHVKVQSSEDQSLDQANQLIAERPSRRCKASVIHHAIHLITYPAPAACFFIRLTDEVGNIFRAIYLTERTAEELRKKISEKYRFDQSKIVRMLRVIKDNLKIVVDDDMVREIAEGQDMIIDICGSSVADDDDSFKEIRLKYIDSG